MSSRGDEPRPVRHDQGLAAFVDDQASVGITVSEWEEKHEGGISSTLSLRTSHLAWMSSAYIKFTSGRLTLLVLDARS